MSEDRDPHDLYAAVLNAPEDKIAEVIDGSLWLSPRPSLRHANAASGLTAELRNTVQKGRSGPGAWWILLEPELHMAESILVPDIAGWRHESLTAIPDSPWIELAPDWICEVVSASTEAADRKRKAAIYAYCCVSYYWIVDPTKRQLEVFIRNGTDWKLVSTTRGDSVVSEPPFEAAAIDLAALWA